MSSPWQPGQLLWVGFDGLRLPDPLADQIAAGRVGGVVLFARNVRDSHQVRELTAALHACAPEGAPLVVAIDQEGGRVQRLRDPWTEWPTMRALGDVDDLDLTRAVGAALARELLDLGIRLDFAPVVDVDTNPANPVIGDRSFGRDPARVGRHAVALLEGLQAGHVAACAKHFPGHGDTHVDSHKDLPVLRHDLDRLRAVELPPFRAAITAGVASIMTAHVLFPELDPRRPATLSPDLLAILREELGYSGLVFSDDLEMKAVAGRHRPADLVTGALGAGVDALLVCSEEDLQGEILRALERAPDRLLEGALGRMVAFKREWGGVGPRDAEGLPPYAEHRALAERFRGAERGSSPRRPV